MQVHIDEREASQSDFSLHDLEVCGRYLGCGLWTESPRQRNLFLMKYSFKYRNIIVYNTLAIRSLLMFEVHLPFL